MGKSNIISTINKLSDLGAYPEMEPLESAALDLLLSQVRETTEIEQLWRAKMALENLPLEKRIPILQALNLRIEEIKNSSSGGKLFFDPKKGQ